MLLVLEVGIDKKPCHAKLAFSLPLRKLALSVSGSGVEGSGDWAEIRRLHPAEG